MKALAYIGVAIVTGLVLSGLSNLIYWLWGKL